ncbi:diguanylate cyclase (GGDEF)-like protein [Novosphingobium chloroacetimidivorans]|uniref:diguanylate cyclase n=1 Tax=Novosphingobium chloroacetimidivorans TaxID=1428314 RepID=A0A7W7KBW4_9SPHN|nr:diguanylate cyclase [Novosphingobium chloroacetimidivorans]MBB4859931.1 diguanylate cyclase (GGDEF)-like protein [Novosphingobium chloroacetimidivorans]
MGLSDWLIRKVDQLHGKAHYFVASIALMGTLLVGSSLIAWRSSEEQRHLATAYTQTLRVLRAANEVKIGTLNTLRGEGGFLLTGEGSELEFYFSGRRRLAQSLDELDRYAVGGEEQKSINRLRHEVGTFLMSVDEVVRIARAGRMNEARSAVGPAGIRSGIAAIDRTADGILENERSRLFDLRSHVERVTRTLLRFFYLMSFAGLCLLVLAVLSAVALRRSFARERSYQAELRKRAETDELTGVANRREILAYLDKRIAEARRLNTPLSFAMFDIDNFKRVNDTHGHAVGDEAIRHVVSHAQGATRINDRIGRMGGEEFGVVLPKSSEDNAYVVCERMLNRLRANPFAAGDDLQLMVTISTGIASLTDEDDAASLIERADKALYEAKRSGRDQVRMAA